MRKRNRFGIFIGLVFVLSIGLYSCGQDYNSNSSDEYLGRDTSQIDCSTDAAMRFCAALTIFQTHCITCHTHSSWGKFTTEAHFIDADVVIPGNPDSSEIITKLINAGGNMPQDAGALSDADYQTLRTWVSEMSTTNLRKSR